MPQTATPPQASAARPQPAYTDLFQEPVYPDGPYDRGDEDDEGEA